MLFSLYQGLYALGERVRCTQYTQCISCWSDVNALTINNLLIHRWPREIYVTVSFLPASLFWLDFSFFSFSSHCYTVLLRRLMIWSDDGMVIGFVHFVHTAYTTFVRMATAITQHLIWYKPCIRAVPIQHNDHTFMLLMIEIEWIQHYDILLPALSYRSFNSKYMKCTKNIYRNRESFWKWLYNKVQSIVTTQCLFLSVSSLLLFSSDIR